MMVELQKQYDLGVLKEALEDQSVRKVVRRHLNRESDLGSVASSIDQYLTQNYIGQLSYFNSFGRAEQIRLMLNYAGVRFFDERIAKEDWPTRKHEFPGSVLPCWQYSGSSERIGDTFTILKQLGAKYGFFPEPD